MSRFSKVLVNPDYKCLASVPTPIVSSMPTAG